MFFGVGKNGGDVVGSRGDASLTIAISWWFCIYIICYGLYNIVMNRLVPALISSAWKILVWKHLTFEIRKNDTLNHSKSYLDNSYTHLELCEGLNRVNIVLPQNYKNSKRCLYRYNQINYSIVLRVISDSYRWITKLSKQDFRKLCSPCPQFFLYLRSFHNPFHHLSKLMVLFSDLKYNLSEGLFLFCS